MSDLTDEDLRPESTRSASISKAAWGRGDRPRIGDYLDGPAGRHFPGSTRPAPAPHRAGAAHGIAARSPRRRSSRRNCQRGPGVSAKSSRRRGAHAEPAPTLLCLPSTAPGGGKGFGLPEFQGFKILDELGRGTMGVVYKGWQVPLDRFVAIKTIAPGGSCDRFRKEAKLIAQISSPHVVAVHDLHTLPDGGLLLVMEYVEGTDLRRIMKTRGGPIPEEEALPWMRQVAEGMLAASERLGSSIATSSPRTS